MSYLDALMIQWARGPRKEHGMSLEQQPGEGVPGPEAARDDASAAGSTQSAKEYPLSEETTKEIDLRFKYHAPVADQAFRYEQIRSAARHLSTVIHLLTPPSREQSLAITKLEESVMWANASIARRELHGALAG